MKPCPAILPRDPNAAIFVCFERIETACQALLILLSTAEILASLKPGPGWTAVLGWLPMRPDSAAAILISTLCLMFLGTGQTRWNRWLSPLLAGAVAFLAVFVLLQYPIAYLPEVVTEFARAHMFPVQTSMPQISSAFLLLGFTMGAMTLKNRTGVWLADLLTLGLCIFTLTLVSGDLFGTWRMFGNQAGVPSSRGTLVCLLLLTVVTVLRRTENGILSIFTGSGNGGKLARLLGPVLLIMPFLRECTRARIIGTNTMPPPYITALMASSAAFLSISLLLYLVWRINSMETEIHLLALRDELTGLHNLRGFRLLADQAMRLAMRSGVPFSVMFIDLDDLKVINDSLGHETGSAYLSEAAEILRAAFRETDVLGRIGGDEFAVAGQFSRRSISATMHQLKESCAQKNREESREFPLSLSIGHATLDETNRATLDTLMAAADEAMYEAKRFKKEQRAGKSNDAFGGNGASAKIGKAAEA
jgi:diguanylate cyclase (GGDEF)-like protein